MRWLLRGIGNDGRFDGVINPVLGIGLAPRYLDQGLYATFFVGMLIESPRIP